MSDSRFSEDGIGIIDTDGMTFCADCLETQLGEFFDANEITKNSLEDSDYICDYCGKEII